MAAIEKRESFFQNEETTAFRVFNGEGDGIGGLTIDYFAGYYVINWYSKGIYHFKDTIIGVLTDHVNIKESIRKNVLRKMGNMLKRMILLQVSVGSFLLL